MNPKDTLHTELCIGGMTCKSCEILLERKLKAVPGIVHVEIRHKTGIARITAEKDRLPKSETIESVIRKAGYSLIDGDAPTLSSVAGDGRKWMEIGASLIIIFALYKLLDAFNLVSLAPSTTGTLSYGGIFLIGIAAGTSSCLAVTGGLLLAMAAKYNETHESETTWHKFRPLLQFNIGRLVSYFVLGGAIGMLGQSLTLSTKVTGYLNIAIAVVMFFVALMILEIVPKGSFPIHLPKRISHAIAGLSESEHPLAPFLLGAGTFFLPCGFTQSLQLAALASGTFVSGSLIMFIFAVGTLPSLLGISAISSTARGSASRIFLRFSGTLVFILALWNVRSGLVLTGVNLPSSGNAPAAAAQIPVNGVQQITMAVTSQGYVPDTFTIKAGIPVRWSIDGSNAIGCTSIITVPSLGIRKSLAAGENIIEFTAPNKGPIGFSCSMGMVTGTFNAI